MSNRESSEKRYLDIKILIADIVKLPRHKFRGRNPANRQEEAIDANGNRIIYVYKPNNKLFCPIEIQDAHGNLLARSTDDINWQTENFGEPGIDFTLESADDDLVRMKKITRMRNSVRAATRNPDMDERYAA